MPWIFMPHRRPLAVVALCAGLVAATSSVAAPASAGILRLPVVCQASAGDFVGAPDPGNPDRIEFRGSGPVTCVAPGLTSILLRGESTFSGTIPKAECTGITSGAVYHAQVRWEDGTVTSGTYTNFQDVQLSGTAAVLISGTTDSSSTRYANYLNTIVTTSLGGCGTAGQGASKTQLGVVTYLPGPA